MIQNGVSRATIAALLVVSIAAIGVALYVFQTRPATSETGETLNTGTTAATSTLVVNDNRQINVASTTTDAAIHASTSSIEMPAAAPIAQITETKQTAQKTSAPVAKEAEAEGAGAPVSGFALNPFYTEKCPFITYSMATGSRDATTDGQVTKLQDFLREQNLFSKASNGVFDQDTMQAVARWQKYVGFAGQIKTLGTVGDITREHINGLCKVGSMVPPKIGSLYTTPKGTPTINMPEGWTAHVVVDEPIVPIQKSGVRTVVNFVDEHSPHYRGLTYMLYSNGGATGGDVGAVESQIMQNLIGRGAPQTTSISNNSLSPDEYGMPVTELFYEGPNDITDAASFIKTRIFSVQNFTTVVTAASAKEFTPETDIHTWSKPVFDTAAAFTHVNGAFTATPITEYLNAEFTDIRSIPKGTAADFYLSKCYPITFDMTVDTNNTDAHSDGQVSELQKMLLEKYSMSPFFLTSGKYGANTALLVARFQREMGLEGSGGVGAKTREALDHCKTK